MAKPIASIGRQIGALFYDLLICLALAGLVSTVWVAVNGGEALPSGHLGLQASLLLMCMAYFLVSHRVAQQTIGMRAWSLVIVNAGDARRPGLGALLLRMGIAIPSIALLGLGYWCAMFRQDGRTLADLGSGTTVVYRPT